MKARSAVFAATLTLLLGIALLVGIGFGVDVLRGTTAAVAATARINDGAAEIARGPAVVGPASANQMR